MLLQQGWNMVLRRGVQVLQAGRPYDKGMGQSINRSPFHHPEALPHYLFYTSFTNLIT